MPNAPGNKLKLSGPTFEPFENIPGGVIAYPPGSNGSPSNPLSNIIEDKQIAEWGGAPEGRNNGEEQHNPRSQGTRRAQAPAGRISTRSESKIFGPRNRTSPGQTL